MNIIQIATGIMSLLCYVGLTAATTDETAKSDNQVSLRISVKSGSHLVGEPVIINIELTNVGETPIITSPHLDNLTQSAAYFASPAGQRLGRVRFEICKEPSLRSITLAPGQSMYHAEMLFFDGAKGKPVFAKPGDYSIRVEWTHPSSHQRIQSNKLDITVKAPQLETLKYSEPMQEVEVMQSLHRITEDPRAIQKLKWIAASQTVFARFASLCLAEKEMRWSSLGIELEELPKQKAQYFQRVSGWLRIADAPDFPLHARVLQLRARVATEMGHVEQAKSILKQIERDYFNTKEGQEAKELLANAPSGND